MILCCIVGDDVSQMPIDQWANGKCEKQSLQYALRENLGSLFMRMGSPQVLLFPVFANIFVTQFDRDTRENSRNIRMVFRDLVRKRQANPKKSGNSDLLDILLSDPVF